MSAKDKARCSNCRRLQARVAALEKEVAALKAIILELREQLAAARKDSSSSSKPPSSDIVKPPKPPPEGEDGRKIGGQPGHPMHERAAYPPEALTGEPFDYYLDLCPRCGGDLERNLAIAPRVIQQVDITNVPLSILEHRSHSGWCPHCQKVFEAPLPTPIARGGLVGPKLTTLIAYLKGVCHASFSTVRKFLRDVVHVTISRGKLATIIGKVSESLAPAYEELLASLPVQDRLGVDETGHKQNGKRRWTWCFRAGLYTLFKIDQSRGAEVLVEVLGTEFNGVLGCDYFSAYRRYLRECGVVVQFCLAHLIRDVKYLTTLPDARDREYGERLRVALRNLFELIHRRDEFSAADFERLLDTARRTVLWCGTHNVPPTRASSNMSKRFEKHGESYFRFITTPGVAPTNNLTEQAIRFVVIDRHITQGTRSEAGNRWCERIWTVIATCTQQGRSIFDYLEAAVTAWFNASEPPTLQPGG
jgi:transposase